MKKKLRYLISALILVTLLASACGGAAPTAAPEVPEEKPEATSAPESKPEEVQEVTTLTWLTLGWPAPPDVIPLFEAENPDIKIEYEQIEFRDFFPQIQIRFGAGSETPDIINVDVPLVSGYGVRDWLLPLDDAFTAEERADWLPAANEAAQFQGKLLAPPQQTSTQLLFLNLDMFEAAGIDPPGVDDRLTWEELADIAMQLVVDEDKDGTPEVWGFQWEQITRIYQLQPMPMSLGGEMLGPDQLTVDGYINSQPWVDAFTYYWKAYNEWKFAPQGDVDTARELFQNGDVAMFVGGPWNIQRINEADVGFDWSVSRHPYFEGGVVVTPTGSWHIGVNINTQHPEAATRFVHWLTTGAGAEAWYRASGEFPAQKSVLALVYEDPAYQEGKMVYYKVAANEATVNPQPRPLTPGYLEYEEILDDAFSDIRNGTDVLEALNTAVERITREMEKYR